MSAADLAAGSEFAAFVGLDWADQKHDVVLVDADRSRPEHAELTHTPEALDQWACELRRRYAGRAIAVCLEKTHGPIVYALQKYDFLVLLPLPPGRLSSYRESFTSSGAKDDPTDAALLLDYLLHHRDQLREWKPDTAETRELQLLTAARRAAVDQRTQFSNQLTAVLKLYFPQALALAGQDLDTKLACDFLSRWPTLESVKRASPETIRRFYWGHHCRNQDLIAGRLELAKSAIPLTNDQALINSGRLQVSCLVGLIRAVISAIAGYDKRIKQLMDRHPDAELFRALPGAGAALAPRLLAAFGTDRDRFQTAEEMQSLSGIAPVTKRSGKRKVVQRRWACPKFLLQTFHEFAGCSVPQSAWSTAFYAQQRMAGKGRNAALRALAFKWIRIIFHCWKTRTEYSEEVYLAALKRRNAPLLKYLTPTAN